MHKFAHMADTHLGNWRDEKLQSACLGAFKKAVSVCIEKKVDFVVMSGDIFHTHVPSMEIAREAIRELKKLKEAGIRVYCVKGSHDYSRVGSIIDLLNEVGLVTDVYKPRIEDKKGNQALFLDVVVDEKTNAKLFGLPGLPRRTIETYYELLDRKSLEKESGFRVFVFHAGIRELLPAKLGMIESISLSLFPKGFDYYAGGHIHESNTFNPENYGSIVFPGALFPTSQDEFSDNKNGIYIVEFDESGVKKIGFEEIKVKDSVFLSVSVDKLSPEEAFKKIVDAIRKQDLEDKIFILKLEGTLKTGTIIDLNIQRIQEVVRTEKKPYAHGILRSKLMSAEITHAELAASRKSREELEKDLFREQLTKFQSEEKALRGGVGLSRCVSLLELLGKEYSEDVGAKKAFESELIKNAREELGDIL